ncbi:MAG TPA: DNA topoisomerase VI subunit B [Nitrososphaeraceae archaeon]
MKNKATTEVVNRSSNGKVGSHVNVSPRNKIHYHRKAESEFFVDNSALAGFTGERILYMAVRELLENALDSCEINHVLPVISLQLRILDPENDLWIISCKDNGIGIPSDKLPVAVCSFLTSGKYVEKQQRGLFGVGLKMIAAFSTKDTDHPLRVWSKSIDEPEYYFDLRTDIGTNKPIVLEKRVVKDAEREIEAEFGFKVEAVLRARLSPVTRNKIYDYVSQTSVVNPYAIITFDSDDGSVTFESRTSVMPVPAKEVLPHPADMDLKTLKKAILNHINQKTTLHGVLCNSFQKMSIEKAREIILKAGLDLRLADKYNEHELIRVVNVCKHTKFQSPNTDHLSPIGEKILTAGMTSEYAVIMNKENNQDSTPQTYLTVKLLKPSLTAYSSRTCVINNRPTVVECGIAYGGDIGSFKLFRFANKIPLLYDEGSDVAKEVISEVEINKMGITKKEVKEQFRNAETRSDRAIDYLPMHIFFHICSTKIPYKTAGKESIAAEGDLKRYMKSCLSDLYRKVSAQIRRELKIKENENKLRLYRHYIPFIVTAISESIKVDVDKLTSAFNLLAERFIGNELQSLSEIPGETNSTLMDNTHVDVINTKDRKTTYLKTKSVPNLGHNKKAIQSQSQKTHQSTSQVTLDSFKQSKGKKR